MSVTVDAIEGAGGSRDKDGWRVLRIAKVSGLSGFASRRVIDAVTAVAAKVGNIGVPHPDEGTLILSRFTARALESPDKMNVEIEYREDDPFIDPEEDQVEVGSTVGQAQTYFDYKGDPIFVTYQDGVDGTVRTQGGTVTKQEPRASVTITRKENRSPLSKSMEYVGKVNSGGWRYDGGDNTPRTWLCSRIIGRSNDGGRTFQVQHTFEYQSHTHDEDVFFIDEETGRPPPDADLAKEHGGIKKVQVLNEGNFNNIL